MLLIHQSMPPEISNVRRKKKFAPLDIDALLAEKNEKRRAAAEAASAAAAATAASDMAERAGSQALPSARRGPGAGSRVEVLTEAVEEGPASIRSGSAAAARGVKSEMDEAEDLLRRMDGLDEVLLRRAAEPGLGCWFGRMMWILLYIWSKNCPLLLWSVLVESAECCQAPRAQSIAWRIAMLWAPCSVDGWLQVLQR